MSFIITTRDGNSRTLSIDCGLCGEKVDATKSLWHSVAFDMEFACGDCAAEQGGSFEQVKSIVYQSTK